MKHIMFDVDGTLVESYGFDERLFCEAVQEVTGIELASNWATYPNVTDRGILKTFIERQASNYVVADLERSVKPLFIEKINNHLKITPAKAVVGAVDFFEILNKRDDVVVSIATGGWGETAKAKLKSAGFNISGLPMASSCDHYRRTEIMKIAGTRATNNAHESLTYFGDAQWDINACTGLAVNLVIVGDQVEYHQSISDFSDVDQALAYI